MKKPKFHGNRNVQYLAMFSGAFLSLASGINLGWASPYLPLLQDPSKNPPFLITSNEASWCAVMPLVGAPVGAFVAAQAVDKIGRKNLLLSLAPIITACFLLIAYSYNIYMLSSARFIVGSAEGAIYTALPIYLGEIADPGVRGVLGASIAVAALIGALFINVVGEFMDMFSSGVVCSFVSLIFLGTFIFMPESPYYLLKKGRDEEARVSLMRFRGMDSPGIREELTKLKEAVKRQESDGKSSVLEIFKVGSNRKALGIYLILICTNKFSGMNPVVFYLSTIFEEAGGLLDSFTSVVVFNTAGVLATLVAVSFVDRFGRRPIMLFSAIGCAVSLAGEALYFTVQSYCPSYLIYLTWLPVTSLVAYNVIFCFGLSFGPVVFLSELFPTSVKANALGLADTLSITMGTVASKFFHFLREYYGMHVPFWTFSLCATIGSYLIYVLVPETKGKTLEDIQLELIGVNKRNVS